MAYLLHEAGPIRFMALGRFQQVQELDLPRGRTHARQGVARCGSHGARSVGHGYRLWAREVAQTREERGELVVAGLEAAGLHVLPGYDLGASPLILELEGPDAPLRIYSWRITHGGATRSPDEFRVQITGVPGSPEHGDDHTTLLLGFDETRGVFGAWDVRRHSSPGRSPSLQIPADLLDEASREGIASRARQIASGEELLVAFRPEAFGAYLEMLPELPGPDASATDLRASAKAASGDEVPVEELPPDVERRTAIRRIEVRVRDARFRSRVVRAYQGRCAICGVGAGLVQAAHIQPVAQGGPDQVVNGLALCPTHHLALDRGLLTIGDDGSISVSEIRARGLGLTTAETAEFQATLADRLAQPEPSELRPAAEHIAFRRGLGEE